MEQTKLLAVSPVLPSRDVLTSIDFYVVRLGFTSGFRDSPHDPRYPGLRRDAVELHVQGHDPTEWEAVQRSALRFVVQDVRALFGEYSEKGVFHKRPGRVASRL